MTSVALATGLYTSHTFVPPTPGHIAAVGNLDLSDKLGLVIMVGIVVSAFTVITGYLWAQFAGRRWTSGEDGERFDQEAYDNALAEYGELPSATKAFAPIVKPIVLIALGSVTNFPGQPLGEGTLTRYGADGLRFSREVPIL